MKRLSQQISVRFLQMFLIVPFITAALGMMAGCRQKTDNATEQPIPVRLRLPNQFDEPVSVSASGSVEADSTALTAFEVGGRVAQVFVEEGEAVKQGQVLAELDPSDYRNAFDAASGQAAAAEATALQAKNGLRPQELDEAKIDLDRAEDEYRRQKYLFDHQSLPANDYHKVEAVYLAAMQRYEMAHQGTRPEQQQAATSQAISAKAQLTEAKKRLSDCQLRAPSSGFIGVRKISAGDMVAPGATAFSILKLDPIKVSVGIPETEIGKVREGARAMVTVPSLDNQHFEGKVEALGVTADRVSRTFSAKIVVPNPSHLLRDGMVSESRIYGEARLKALTLPAVAITRDPKGVPFVYVYDNTRRRVFARRVDIGDLLD